MKQKVDLQSAWAWTCLKCRHMNTELSVRQELTDEDKIGIARYNEIIEDWQPDEAALEELRHVAMYSYPDDLTCKNCGAEFIPGEVCE